MRAGIRREREEGFSLTELMVALAIIAVLTALALPTLLGPKKAAQDTAAQTRVLLALKTEETHATDRGTYTTDESVLESLEPALDWSGVQDGAIHVVVASVVDADDAVLLYTRSNSGTWFGLRHDRAGALAGRHTCSGAAAGDTDDMTDCTGDDW